MPRSDADKLVEQWAALGRLPSYAPMLAAFHRSHEIELRHILENDALHHVIFALARPVGTDDPAGSTPRFRSVGRQN